MIKGNHRVHFTNDIHEHFLWKYSEEADYTKCLQRLRRKYGGGVGLSGGDKSLVTSGNKPTLPAILSYIFFTIWPHLTTLSTPRVRYVVVMRHAVCTLFFVVVVQQPILSLSVGCSRLIGALSLHTYETHKTHMSSKLNSFWWSDYDKESHICINKNYPFHVNFPSYNSMNWLQTLTYINCKPWRWRPFLTLWSTWQKVIIGWGNVFAPRMQKTITWGNADPVRWRINTSLRSNILIPKDTFMMKDRCQDRHIL